MSMRKPAMVRTIKRLRKPGLRVRLNERRRKSEIVNRKFTTTEFVREALRLSKQLKGKVPADVIHDLVKAKVLGKLVAGLHVKKSQRNEIARHLQMQDLNIAVLSGERKSFADVRSVVQQAIKIAKHDGVLKVQKEAEYFLRDLDEIHTQALRKDKVNEAWDSIFPYVKDICQANIAVFNHWLNEQVRMQLDRDLITHHMTLIHAAVERGLNAR
ncbi:MAG: hypothetical protein Q7S92_01020 [Candidatus Diapherotrites archaeon]|nr:hypothetical protein [Candidatus Diapherotrites archaeon]